MKELNHLAEIFENYDTFIIDLWGVMHNGVSLNPNAIEAVDKLKKNSKKMSFEKILFRNSPPPGGVPPRSSILPLKNRKFLPAAHFWV